MKLGFAILSHREPDWVFEKLLEFLSAIPGASIVVHHDYSKSNFNEALIDRYRLHMVTPYYQTQWGNISKMTPMFKTWEELFKVDPDIEWIISISPNCYPIKSMRHILEFFEKAQFDYYMEANPIGRKYGWIYKWHDQTLFSKVLVRIPFLTRKGKFYWKYIRYRINPEKTPFNSQMKPYAGSDWYFLRRNAAKRVLAADLVNHPIGKFISKANKYPDKQSSPDEVLVQTFLMNQKDLTWNPDNFRFIDWEHAVDWHPNTLTIDYWNRIKESHALFGRKFLNKQSDELIQKIDEEILNAS